MNHLRSKWIERRARVERLIEMNFKRGGEGSTESNWQLEFAKGIVGGGVIFLCEIKPSLKLLNVHGHP